MLNNIMITNLTARQKVMLDILWKINSQSEVTQLLSAVHYSDRIEFMNLIELIKHEFLDSVDSVDLSADAIGKIMKK